MTVGSPAPIGWNWTLKEALCPAAKVSGVARPVIAKPEPNPWIELMVTEDEVPFVIVSGSVLLVPIGTDPKFRLLLPSPIPPAPVEPPIRPWHPVSSNRPPAITREMTER